MTIGSLVAGGPIETVTFKAALPLDNLSNDIPMV